MKSMKLILSAAIMFLLLGLPTAQADAPKSSGCLTHVDLSKEAEFQEGGSMFSPAMHMQKTGMPMQGPMTMSKTVALEKHANMQRDKEGSHDEEKEGHVDKTVESEKHANMKPGQEDEHKEEKKASHDIHKGQHGGVFFMAPNKIHHVEGIYSKKCGFSLVIFNAHTKPINVNRFRAFVKYVPEDEDQLEAIRFLLPTKDGSLLKAPSVDIEGPYEVELYLKFPAGEEPAMFNIPASHDL
ncbi:MAG: hypothetical protein V3S16_08650 [Candidatus Desulfatibia sp.]|uniref:hypothetical protein n=1 Tax=Candidatus Desulfatibia sp. TaxID=3101189 RepID=UPI002F30323E